MKIKLLQGLYDQWANNSLLEELQEALGKSKHLDLFTDQIDSSKLSQMLHPVKGQLNSTDQNWEEVLGSLSAPLVLEDLDNVASLEAAYDQHMRHAMQAFALLKGEEPQKSWVELNNADFALVPPVVIYIPLDCYDEKIAVKLTMLLQGTREFKILIQQSQIHQSCNASGRRLVTQASLDFGFFGLIFRSAYILQIPSHLPEFEAEIDRVFSSPRPALISVYDPEDPSLAELALTTRAFPFLRFDPEAGLHWADSLDLSLNPSFNVPLNSNKGDENNKPLRTLADFLYAQNPSSFTPLQTEGIPLTEWVQSKSSQVPYLQIKEQKFAIPDEYLAKILYQIQLWDHLTTMAGSTPKDRAEGAEEKLEKRIQEERSKAVLKAMENLSAKLLGVSDYNVTLVEEGVSLELSSTESKEDTSDKASKTTKPALVPAPSPEQSTENEEAWIESALCTACDECTGINPRMFEYNKEKQAILKDPTAGPYADLVKSAEKCSASIIHPGKPLNPKEKNLEKWIKRAKKLGLD